MIWDGMICMMVALKRICFRWNCGCDMKKSGLITRGTQQESVKKHDVCSRSTMCFYLLVFMALVF